MHILDFFPTIDIHGRPVEDSYGRVIYVDAYSRQPIDGVEVLHQLRMDINALPDDYLIHFGYITDPRSVPAPTQQAVARGYGHPQQTQASVARGYGNAQPTQAEVARQMGTSLHGSGGASPRKPTASAQQYTQAESYRTVPSEPTQKPAPVQEKPMQHPPKTHAQKYEEVRAIVKQLEDGCIAVAHNKRLVRKSFNNEGEVVFVSTENKEGEVEKELTTMEKVNEIVTHGLEGAITPSDLSVQTVETLGDGQATSIKDAADSFIFGALTSEEPNKNTPKAMTVNVSKQLVKVDRNNLRTVNNVGAGLTAQLESNDGTDYMVTLDMLSELTSVLRDVGASNVATALEYETLSILEISIGTGLVSGVTRSSNQIQTVIGEISGTLTSLPYGDQLNISVFFTSMVKDLVVEVTPLIDDEETKGDMLCVFSLGRRMVVAEGPNNQMLQSENSDIFDLSTYSPGVITKDVTPRLMSILGKARNNNNVFGTPGHYLTLSGGVYYLTVSIKGTPITILRDVGRY